jgi:hypothetical protein
MDKVLQLAFGLVRPNTCKPTQAKLVTAIAAMLMLSTICADAAKRHVRKAPRHAAHHAKVARLPIHVPSESSYWMYRLCSPAARAADPYTVCFPPHGVRSYLGRDPDANVRFELRRDWFRGALMEIIEDRRFADLGGMALAGSPAEFGSFIADETEKWGKVIRAVNIKAP